MSSTNFTITKHVSPSQYMRGFPHCVKREDAVLKLAVKEYRPRRSIPVSGSAVPVTIIAAHGNGFPKETYEPLWDDLLKAENDNFRIGSIWIADIAHQGASYAANQEELGDENDWLDHSRDLLLMVNEFRDRMKPPFVGIGHSMGCAQIAWLSIMHPRLFHSLILIEPVILDSVPPGPNAAMMSSLRRDTFPSRAATEAQMRRNAFFKPFDPRALQAYFAHSLLDRSDGSVVLATPKAQEAWSYVRPNFHPLPADTTTAEARNKERLLDPDLVPFSENSKAVFKRPECVVVMDAMPHLRPRTFFMFGDFSYINYEEAREKLVARTGTGRGGNGGVADGGVEVKVVDDAGHLCCFEKPTVMAADMAVWLDKEMARWRREKEFWATYDREVSKNGGKELSEKWMQGVKQESTLQRPVANDGSKL